MPAYPCEAGFSHPGADFGVVTRRPLFRVYPEPCPSTKPFEFDTRFHVIRGGEFFVAGNVVFPHKGGKLDLGYRSLIGPCYSHSGTIYENSNHSLNLAIRRKLGLRLEPDDELAYDRLPASERNAAPFNTRHPDQPYAYWLEANQREFLEHTDLVDRMAASYVDSFADYTFCLDMVERFHDEPHQKRNLRIHEWVDRCEAGELLADIWFTAVTQSVHLKVKRDEWAKFVRILSKLKYPRAIGDFGVGASLQGAWLTSFLKCAQAEHPIQHADGECWHIKSPSGDALDSAFEKLLSPPGAWFFIAFSDDAVFAIRTANGVKWFNIDISSCDTGHTEEIFRAYTRLYPRHIQPDVEVLVRQCAAPVRVVSVEDRRDFVLLQRGAPTLSSGSTVTTSINTFVSFLLGCTFGQNRCASSVSIRRMAKVVGYDVSVEPCDVFERVQFLKRSPVLCHDGRYRGVINFGVYLRLSGTCRGDLPGRGDITIRARKFQAALINGVFAGSHSSILDSLRQQYANAFDAVGNNRPFSELVSQYLYYLPDPDANCTFTDDAYFKRYNLACDEIRELTTVVTSMGPGDHYASPTVERILEADYGLACSYFDLGFLERENRTYARLSNAF